MFCLFEKLGVEFKWRDAELNRFLSTRLAPFPVEYQIPPVLIGYAKNGGNARG